MSIFLEPVYLNENMVLNCAAYLFKGVSLESEDTEQKTVEGKGNLQLGISFLQQLISPLSVQGELGKTSSKEIKTARRYTLGGLHMVVLDELQKKEHHLIQVDPSFGYDAVNESYIEIDAVLQPIDFYNLIEILKTITPLAIQLITNFGPMLKKSPPNKKMVSDIQKYEKVITSILTQLENDYLKSGQLEMIMVNPDDPSDQYGIVDIDVRDYEPSSVKARLTDGQFHIIGKVTKHVGDEGSLSLVNRTFLATLMDLLSKIVNMNTEQTKITQYKEQIQKIKPMVEGLCQLKIEGPAYRIMAMSICV